MWAGARTTSSSAGRRGGSGVSAAIGGRDRKRQQSWPAPARLFVVPPSGGWGVNRLKAELRTGASCPSAEVVAVPRTSRFLLVVVFALALFLSAALLFVLELLAGKMMLPLLGGTPAVWNTCMVFFQAVLLAGYAFAHASSAGLGPRRQARLQLFVLLLPIISFVVNAMFFSGLLSPSDRLILGREANPIPALL